MSAQTHMSDWYARFYTATQTSAAYSQYCSEVFGKDFSQHGYSDVTQINRILKSSNVKDGDIVLDLGCGNGKMLEYIYNQHNITAHGVDFSADAIEQAQSRTRTQQKSLMFKVGLIGDKLFVDNTFDVILSIETIFFGESMAATLNTLLAMLKPNGVIAATYMLRKAETDSTGEAFDAHSNDLALALKELNLVYTTTDFTKPFFEHMRKKRVIAENLKKQFETEDNLFLYENIMMESVDKDICFEDFKTRYARYCYFIKEKS